MDWCLGAHWGTDLIAEDSQTRKGLLLALVLRDFDQWARAAALGLGGAEHLLVGLELELEGSVAVCQELVLGLCGAELGLGRLVLLLEGGDQLLQLHAANLRLQLLRELGCDLLLADEVHDNGQHEVDQVDCSLHDVLLGLGQALGWVPAGSLQEEIVDATVELAVQLAQVLAAVALRDAVLFALVIEVVAIGAALALASAELLQRGLAVDVLRGNQGHDLGLGEIVGPVGRNSLLGCEGLLPGALGGVGRRWRGNNLLATRPGRLELERVIGTRCSGENLLGLERVEGAPRQRLHAWQRRKTAVLAQVGAHIGGGRFQRAE